MGVGRRDGYLTEPNGVKHSSNTADQSSWQPGFDQGTTAARARRSAVEAGQSGWQRITAGGDLHGLVEEWGRMANKSTRPGDRGSGPSPGDWMNRGSLKGQLSAHFTTPLPRLQLFNPDLPPLVAPCFLLQPPNDAFRAQSTPFEISHLSSLFNTHRATSCLSLSRRPQVSTFNNASSAFEIRKNVTLRFEYDLDTTKDSRI
jgi:hypothetical protein